MRRQRFYESREAWRAAVAGSSDTTWLNTVARALVCVQQKPGSRNGTEIIDGVKDNVGSNCDSEAIAREVLGRLVELGDVDALMATLEVLSLDKGQRYLFFMKEPCLSVVALLTDGRQLRAFGLRLCYEGREMLDRSAAAVVVAAIFRRLGELEEVSVERGGVRGEVSEV